MPSLFVVPGGVSSQLEHLGRQIFHHGGEIDRRTGADALRVVAFPQQTVDPSHGELEPGPAAAGLRLPLGLTWKRGYTRSVVEISPEDVARRNLSSLLSGFPPVFFLVFLLTAFAASRHVSSLTSRERARLLFPHAREGRGGRATRDR